MMLTLGTIQRASSYMSVTYCRFDARHFPTELSVDLQTFVRIEISRILLNVK